MKKYRIPDERIREYAEKAMAFIDSIGMIDDFNEDSGIGSTAEEYEYFGIIPPDVLESADSIVLD